MPRSSQIPLHFIQATTIGGVIGSAADKSAVLLGSTDVLAPG
jgi:hypothetical protein